MDHRYIEENQVIERYLMGRLTAAEEERFEEHFLRCQTCLDELEMGERFHAAVKGVAAEDAAVASRLGLMATLARLLRSPRAGLLLVAALVLMLVPAGYLWRQVDRLDQERQRLTADLERALEPRANPPLLRLSPLRSHGGEPDVRITLSSEPEWFVLALELGAAAAESYRLTLRGPDGASLWTADALEPDLSGTLILSLHSSRFTPGDHELLLEPAGDAAPSTRFAFRVLPPS